MVKIIKLDLVIFNDSLFKQNHLFTTTMAEFASRVSELKFLCVKSKALSSARNMEKFFKEMCGKSRVKSKGPRTEPRGTPQVILPLLEAVPLMSMHHKCSFLTISRFDPGNHKIVT